ncbi:MAG: HAMP domain-containing histidine kinase [Catenulispora sp.]|nr:HAMP domain-containing histidine kinase [Catenulispora sp.]
MSGDLRPAASRPVNRAPTLRFWLALAFSALLFGLLVITTAVVGNLFLGYGVYTAVYQLRQVVAVGGGLYVIGLAVVSWFGGWFTAGLVVRPLEQIAEVVDTVTGSRMNVRVGHLRGPEEVRRLTEKLDAMLDRLDDAFTGQDRFIANAAHELKTPLVINRTLVEVAMNRPGAPEAVLHLGENLLEVGTRHERLIDALLMLARAEQAPSLHVPVDLSELVASDAMGVARAEAARRGVRVSDDLEPAETRGDPVLLEHVVRNLVDNAVRYNVPGGAVQVRTGHTARGATLEVANTGPVIAAHEVPMLFEPFRRLTDRVGSAHGSGLGLSIVRAVVRSHGGRLQANPREDGGLVVTVTLPA